LNFFSSANTFSIKYLFFNFVLLYWLLLFFIFLRFGTIVLIFLLLYKKIDELTYPLSPIIFIFLLPVFIIIFFNVSGTYLMSCIVDILHTDILTIFLFLSHKHELPSVGPKGVHINMIF
jgi:hypothetical protein